MPYVEGASCMEWRVALEWALEVEADPENHTPMWAARVVHDILERERERERKLQPEGDDVVKCVDCNGRGYVSDPLALLPASDVTTRCDFCGGSGQVQRARL